MGIEDVCRERSRSGSSPWSSPTVMLRSGPGSAAAWVVQRGQLSSSALRALQEQTALGCPAGATRAVLGELSCALQLFLLRYPFISGYCLQPFWFRSASISPLPHLCPENRRRHSDFFVLNLFPCLPTASLQPSAQAARVCRAGCGRVRSLSRVWLGPVRPGGRRRLWSRVAGTWLRAARAGAGQRGLHFPWGIAAGGRLPPPPLVSGAPALRGDWSPPSGPPRPSAGPWAEVWRTAAAVAPRRWGWRCASRHVTRRRSPPPPPLPQRRCPSLLARLLPPRDGGPAPGPPRGLPAMKGGGGAAPSTCPSRRDRDARGPAGLLLGER